MSQNLDATAINQIHALISAQGVNEIISKIGADAVALPENFRIHDLEKFNLNRFRFRGALSTASIDDFTRYSKEGANKRGNSSRLTQSFHFFMFEPIFSPVNALNQPI